MDRRRIVGAVWSGWRAQDRAFAAGEGRRGLTCARDFPLKGGSALVSSTDSTDVARATALARSAGGYSVRRGRRRQCHATGARRARLYLGQLRRAVVLPKLERCRSAVKVVICRGAGQRGIQSRRSGTTISPTVEPITSTGQTLTHCTTRWHVDGSMRLLSDDAPGRRIPLANGPCQRFTGLRADHPSAS